jgi:hypothetical protein
MCLGLHKENSNAPEQANELIAKASAHLTMRTELAKENAKNALYQNLLATCKPNTFGYVRAKAALGISGGAREDDGRITEMLWDAEKKLMDMTQHYSLYRVSASNGKFDCPASIESILRINVDGVAKRLAGFTEEFLGNANPTSLGKGNTVLPDGEYAVMHNFTPGNLVIQFAGSCRGVNVVIEGISGGTYKVESIKVDGGVSTTTVNSFSEVRSITADPRDGNMTITVGGEELASLQSHEMDTKRRRYTITGCPDGDIAVLLLGRERWYPKLRDTQRMQVEDDVALVLMLTSIHLERAGELEKAVAYEQRAIQQLEMSRKNRYAGETIRIDKSPAYFGLNRVRGGR